MSVSAGGEIREAYERFGNQNWGLSAPDRDGYWLQRVLVHADVRAGARVRARVDVSSSLERGRTGGPRPLVDEDVADLHQAFIDITLHQPAEEQIAIRVGRQELAFGAGRLIALREGTNVPSAFDGVRATVRTGRWQVDGLAVKPASTKPDAFDDVTQHGVMVWGVYATRALGRGAATANGASAAAAVDVYYLGLVRDAARFDQGIADETRHTLGTRVWRRAQWGYDCEVMYQFGRFGTGDVRAWRAVADASYDFTDTRWRPRADLVLDVASGDRNPASPHLQTFNAMFQSGIYSGRAQILGPANTIRLEPSAIVTMATGVTLSTGWGFYWRQSSHDGLYGIAGNLIVPSNGVTARYEGSRPIAQIDWDVTRRLSLHLNYIRVFNGPFERASVHGTSTLSYVSPWLVYRF
jgi:hypothetical protein